jgi:hypothetical protein
VSVVAAETKQIWNPFLPLNEYVPDGEPHVFGDRIYLFGSHDAEGGDRYCAMGDYPAWSAPLNDLTRWRYDGVLYRTEQDPNSRENHNDLYAPDVVQGNDGRYYLYYAVSGPAGEGFDTPISVAVSDEPAGPYEYYGLIRNPDGTRFTRYLPADPAVINDDGTIRLYYGWSLSSAAAAAHGHAESQDIKEQTPEAMKEGLIQAEMMLFKRSRQELEAEPEGLMGANTVVLADDMLTVVGDPRRIVPGEFRAKGTSFEGHAFYEASSIRKIGSTYYFIYSSQLSSELCYATSSDPDRDFVYGGTIISLGDEGYNGRRPADRLNMTGNIHGSIECANGQWYVFYHRQTHNSTYSRQACAEPIEIREDGRIAQVECTSSGLNNGPLLAAGKFPSVIASSITNGHMPHATNRVVNADIPYITHSGDERYITGISEGTTVGYKYFAFNEPLLLTVETRGLGEGRFLVSTGGAPEAEIPIGPSDGWSKASVVVGAAGVAPLLLSYVGNGSADLLSISFDSIDTTP